jgi:hypothetical protein
MKKLIDIENLLIWAFQNEAANLHDVGPDATAGYPQDSILRCEQVSLMGGFVKGTAPGARVLASDSHGDAITVTDAMKALEPHVARLVAIHAKAGSRPDWKPYADFRLEPRNWEWDEATGEEWGRAENCPYQDQGEGWPAAWYDPARKNTVRKTSRWVPIITKDSRDVIDTHRQAYLAWWDALHELGTSLHGALADWELSDIMPDREPWVDQQNAA